MVSLSSCLLCVHRLESIHAVRDSEFLRLFSVDFGWIAPICNVPYAEKFLLNTILMPLGLQGLVYVTWWFSKRTENKDAQNDTEEVDEVLDMSEHAEEMEQEKKASRFGDHYFAFFLTCTCHI